MIPRVALLLLPILAFGQQHAPPGVEEELRGRITGLFKNFLVTSFTPRGAEPFIAEDTKEYFYTASKEKYESFKLDKIEYSDNFTKATVLVIGKAERHMAGQTVMMDLPKIMHWKIENGKWCWTYHQEDYNVTPFEGKNPPAPTAEERAAIGKPKNTSPEAMKAAGLEVLGQQQMGVDKFSITMSADQASSGEIVFTNGADGEVQIALDGPVVRGLTAKLDKTTVPGHGKAVLSLRYDPADKSGPKDVWEPKGSIPFRIIASPFNRSFPVNVVFAAARQ